MKTRIVHMSCGGVPAEKTSSPLQGVLVQVLGSEGTRRSHKHWISSDYRGFPPQLPLKTPRRKAEILGPCSLQLQKTDKEGCEFHAAICLLKAFDVQ